MADDKVEEDDLLWIVQTDKGGGVWGEPILVTGRYDTADALAIEYSGNAGSVNHRNEERLYRPAAGRPELCWVFVRPFTRSDLKRFWPSLSLPPPTGADLMAQLGGREA